MSAVENAKKKKQSPLLVFNQHLHILAMATSKREIVYLKI